MADCLNNQLLTYCFSLPGLSGMPSTLQHLREEVGLAGESWETLGGDWQTLGNLWLRTETALARSGRTDLTFAEIHNLSIPDEWKDWMCAKLMRTEAARPAESFGKVFTDYLNGLPSSAQKLSGTVMNEGWSRPGKTGIVGLILCLYWQAEYAGAGKDWQENIKRVERIFNAILATPDL
jgi:hypothetical protein